MSQLIEIITSTDPEIRNRSLDAFGRRATLTTLLEECAALDAFRRQRDNLYERVRALFFLYALHRFHLPSKPELVSNGRIHPNLRVIMNTSFSAYWDTAKYVTLL